MSMKHNLNWSWSRDFTELLCYIICNGSNVGGAGKSRFSEDQIKCKVKKKLVKILPKYSELDDELIHWIDFFTSFIAIFYTYQKYHESENESDNNEEFGYLYKKNHQEKYMNWQSWRKENAIFWNEWWKENYDDDIFNKYGSDGNGK
jgi:hypothetical protein